MDKQVLKQKLNKTTTDLNRDLALLEQLIKDLNSFDLLVRTKNLNYEFKKLIGEINQKIKVNH